MKRNPLTSTCSVSKHDDGVRVEQADRVIEVCAEFYEQLTHGREDHVEAGEGFLVIHALNGVVRYRLREYDPFRQVWTAHRIS